MIFLDIILIYIVFTLILCTTSESLENRFEVNCLSKAKIWVHIHRLVVTFSFFGKYSLKLWKKVIQLFSWIFTFSFCYIFKKNKSTISYIHVNIQNMKKWGIFLIENNYWVSSYVFSSPGHRPCELLSWVNVRRPSVRPLAFHI